MKIPARSRCWPGLPGGQIWADPWVLRVGGPGDRAATGKFESQILGMNPKTAFIGCIDRYECNLIGRTLHSRCCLPVDLLPGAGLAWLCSIIMKRGPQRLQREGVPPEKRGSPAHFISNSHRQRVSLYFIPIFYIF